MGRRKRRRGSTTEVELNLAAMLDMAFQLLAFFILTFRPSPIEGEIALNLPPPVAMTNTAMQDPSAATGEGIPAAETLPITVLSDAAGGVGPVSLGERVIFEGEPNTARIQLLERELRDILSARGTAFEQVLIIVHPQVSYADLMKVVDVCTRQRFADGTPLNKISFSEYVE